MISLLYMKCEITIDFTQKGISKKVEKLEIISLFEH
jgi:hypothetical protein